MKTALLVLFSFFVQAAEQNVTTLEKYNGLNYFYRLVTSPQYLEIMSLKIPKDASIDNVEVRTELSGHKDYDTEIKVIFNTYHKDVILPKGVIVAKFKTVTDAGPILVSAEYVPPIKRSK
jgi:hypothetical protein